MSHSSTLEVDWEYTRWRDIPKALLEACPQLSELLFVPDFARDQYAACWALFNALRQAFKRGMEAHVKSNLFELNRVVETEEESEGHKSGVDVEEEEDLASAEESEGSEDYYESEGDTKLPGDYKMRGFLYACFTT